MQSAGFSKTDIKAVISANIEVDDFRNQSNNPAHYMPGTQEAGETLINNLIAQAIENERAGRHDEAMQNLGAALHTAQDRWAHHEQGAGWKEHLPWFGTDPDNPERHPQEYTKAYDATLEYIRQYNKDVNKECK